MIRGMSFGVLVVTAEYGGRRITARFAREQNGDVYAVPGKVSNKNSWGPHYAHKAGGNADGNVEDVWEELPQDGRLVITPETGPESPGGQTASLSSRTGHRSATQVDFTSPTRPAVTGCKQRWFN